MGMAPRHRFRFTQAFVRGAGLAVGLWAAGAAAAQDWSARFADPTTRYAHGVLGDDEEWGTLVLSGSREIRFTLPRELVFEDLSPRRIELDGDPAPEWMVVESHQDKGARLALWDENGRITATPFIGTRNRWLAPVGVADLDGDGRVELAYIDRPHLAKTLRVWRYDGGALREVASAKGFSNHRIGWDYIIGGIRRCAGSPPEMIVARGDWSGLVAVRFDGQLSQRDLGRYDAQAAEQALSCP